MVDVGAKQITDRRAVARAVVRMSAETAAAVRSGNAPKGDVIATARIAGIQAAKRTAELIPLCHPLPLTFVDVRIEVGDKEVAIESEARTTGGAPPREGGRSHNLDFAGRRRGRGCIGTGARSAL